MIKVSPLRDDSRGQFEKLFKDYYTELGCDDDVKRLIEDYIMPDLLAGLIHIELLTENGEYAGFVIYQTDDIDNDWNLKEGWGDVRELYVTPLSRRRGLGKFLLYTAEMKLKESGVNRAYCLPYKDSIPFFRACGYVSSGEYNEDTDCFVFEKTNLDNCCKRS